MVSDLATLAAPIVRRAAERTDAMPPELQRAVGAMLAALVRADGRLPSLAGALGRQRQSVEGHARRAGYRPPGVMLRAFRAALLVRLLDAGETGEQAAWRLGWSSANACIRSFRVLTGRTPTRRGALGWEALVDWALAPAGQGNLFADRAAA